MRDGDWIRSCRCIIAEGVSCNKTCGSHFPAFYVAGKRFAAELIFSRNLIVWRVKEPVAKAITGHRAKARCV